MINSLKSVALKLLPEALLKPLRRIRYTQTFRNFQLDEEPDLTIVRALINDRDCAVDIGANLGIYTKYLSRFVGPSGRVISFEPIPFICDILKRNLEKNSISNVEVFCLALSDTTGTATMQVPSFEGVGLSYYDASLERTSGGEAVKVELARLDDIVARDIHFVKCDVEGHEWACLNGGRALIEMQRPALLVEIAGDPDDHNTNACRLMNWLTSLNYRIFIFRDDVLRERRPGDRGLNYFFVQPHHLARLAQFPDVSIDQSP